MVGHDYLGLGGGERGFVLLLDHYRTFHHLFMCRFQVLVVIHGVNSLVLSWMDWATLRLYWSADRNFLSVESELSRWGWGGDLLSLSSLGDNSFIFVWGDNIFVGTLWRHDTIKHLLCLHHPHIYIYILLICYSWKCVTLLLHKFFPPSNNYFGKRTMFRKSYNGYCLHQAKLSCLLSKIKQVLAFSLVLVSDISNY